MFDYINNTTREPVTIAAFTAHTPDDDWEPVDLSSYLRQGAKWALLAITATDGDDTGAAWDMEVAGTNGQGVAGWKVYTGTLGNGATASIDYRIVPVDGDRKFYINFNSAPAASADVNVTVYLLAYGA